jgi:hypothetical protein
LDFSLCLSICLGDCLDFFVAYFVRQFGHDTLSYLFLLHALTVIVGSILFIRLSHLFSLESLFLGFILFALSFLLVAQFLVGRGDFFMLVALFFVEGFVFIQLSINFDTFVERLFRILKTKVRTVILIERSTLKTKIFWCCIRNTWIRFHLLTSLTTIAIVPGHFIAVILLLFNETTTS